MFALLVSASITSAFAIRAFGVNPDAFLTALMALFIVFMGSFVSSAHCADEASILLAVGMLDTN